MQLARTNVVSRQQVASTKAPLRVSLGKVAPRPVVVRFRENEERDAPTTSTDTSKRPVLQPQENAIPVSQTNFTVPAFTRKREIWAGRLAMIGFVAGSFAEYSRVDHPNIIEQVAGYAQALGLPIGVFGVATAFLALVGYNALVALGPGSPTRSPENQADVLKRPDGAPSNPNVSLAEPKQFFGISGWGFTKRNELFQGRLAMLGFAASLVATVLNGGLHGPGTLAQIAGWLGMAPTEGFYSSVPAFFVIWATVATALAYVNGKPGSFEGEEDIY